jgi:hypothetical protein
MDFLFGVAIDCDVTLGTPAQSVLVPETSRSSRRILAWKQVNRLVDLGTRQQASPWLWYNRRQRRQVGRLRWREVELRLSLSAFLGHDFGLIEYYQCIECDVMDWNERVQCVSGGKYGKRQRETQTRTTCDDCDCDCESEFAATCNR